MLVELILLTSSCTAADAVLGNCLQSCETSVVVGGGSVTICSDDWEFIAGNPGGSQPGGATGGSAGSYQPPRPWVLCEVYASGDTVNESITTVWVKIREGSQDCLSIQPYIPPPPTGGSGGGSSTNPIPDQISSIAEMFSASPNRPSASATPATLYADERVSFSVSAATHSKPGELLGESVTVRFSPISASWQFGDGNSATGFSSSHIYFEDGSYRAVASVVYSVDYKLANADWVYSVGNITANSNGVLVTALPLPRETRLVG